MLEEPADDGGIGAALSSLFSRGPKVSGPPAWRDTEKALLNMSATSMKMADDYKEALKAITENCIEIQAAQESRIEYLENELLAMNKAFQEFVNG